jgi:hypothetical protein
MAVLVFEHTRGTAVRINTGGAPPSYAMISVPGTSIGAPSSPFVVTSAAASEAENVQFLPSTADKIYAYAFGRNLGRLTLGGMAFPKYCTPGSTITQPGVKLLFEEYENYRFSKNFKLLNIAFSNMVFNGYLIGCDVNYADSANSIAQWTLQFVTVRSTATTPGLEP